MIYPRVKLYSFIYGLVKDMFEVNLPGLGYALRLIKTDHVVNIKSGKMVFNHKVAPSCG